MKFIIANGEQLRNRLETFPKYYRNTFASSQLLVVCVAYNDEVVGACGISKISNYALAYLHKKFRGRGLGTKLEARTYEEARRHGLDFVAGAIDLWNLPALRVASKVGYKEVVRIRKYGYVILLIPFNPRGELLYKFLHTVLPRLPEVFLHCMVLYSMSFVGQVRQILSVS